jgi:hypothetical protein
MFLVISYLICSKDRWVQLPLRVQMVKQQAMGAALLYRSTSQTDAMDVSIYYLRNLFSISSGIPKHGASESRVF